MFTPTLLGKLVLALSIKNFQQDKVVDFEPNVYLDDVDSLANCGVVATIIGLPGHTNGSIGILAGDSDTFVGTVLNVKYRLHEPRFNINDHIKVRMHLCQ